MDQYTAEVLTHYQTLKGTQGALQYVGVLLDGPEEDPQAGNPLPDKQTAQDIRLERVSFGYIPQQPVLHDLSFTIPHGKVTAIIGNNGSGKSTLLKLLQGIYAPDSGRIWLGGAPVDESKPCELRRQFGYILQNNPLFSGSVRDNIAYGETGSADQRRVEQAARLADADGFIRQLPNGYDTDVARRARCCPAGSGSASHCAGPVHPPHLPAMTKPGPALTTAATRRSSAQCARNSRAIPSLWWRTICAQ